MNTQKEQVRSSVPVLFAIFSLLGLNCQGIMIRKVVVLPCKCGRSDRKTTFHKRAAFDDVAPSVARISSPADVLDGKKLSFASHLFSDLLDLNLRICHALRDKFPHSAVRHLVKNMI